MSVNWRYYQPKLYQFSELLLSSKNTCFRSSISTYGSRFGYRCQKKNVRELLISILILTMSSRTTLWGLARQMSSSFCLITKKHPRDIYESGWPWSPHVARTLYHQRRTITPDDVIVLRVIFTSAVSAKYSVMYVQSIFAASLALLYARCQECDITFIV